MGTQSTQRIHAAPAAKHLIFVSAERASLEVLGQVLEDEGYTVHVNPGKVEAKKVWRVILLGKNHTSIQLFKETLHGLLRFRFF